MNSVFSGRGGGGELSADVGSTFGSDAVGDDRRRCGRRLSADGTGLHGHQLSDRVLREQAVAIHVASVTDNKPPAWETNP